MAYMSLLVTSLDPTMLCEAPLSLLMAALSRGTAEALHTSCISQKVLFQRPQTAEIKLPVSGPHCALQFQLFSSGAWRAGQFATSSVSWEVVTHPSAPSHPSLCQQRALALSFLGITIKRMRHPGKGGTGLCVLVPFPQRCFFQSA